MSFERLSLNPEPRVPKYEQQFRLYDVEASQAEILEKWGITEAALSWVDEQIDSQILEGQRPASLPSDIVPKNRVVIVGNSYILPDESDPLQETDIYNVIADHVPAVWVVEYSYAKNGQVRSDAIDIPVMLRDGNGWIANDLFNDEQRGIILDLIAEKSDFKYRADQSGMHIPDLDETLTDIR